MSPRWRSSHDSLHVSPGAIGHTDPGFFRATHQTLIDGKKKKKTSRPLSPHLRFGYRRVQSRKALALAISGTIDAANLMVQLCYSIIESGVFSCGANVAPERVDMKISTDCRGQSVEIRAWPPWMALNPSRASSGSWKVNSANGNPGRCCKSDACTE